MFLGELFRVVRPVVSHLVHELVDASMDGSWVFENVDSLGVGLDIDSPEVVAVGIEASEDDLVSCDEGEPVEGYGLVESPLAVLSRALAFIKLE